MQTYSVTVPGDDRPKLRMATFVQVTEGVLYLMRVPPDGSAVRPYVVFASGEWLRVEEALVLTGEEMATLDRIKRNLP